MSDNRKGKQKKDESHKNNNDDNLNANPQMASMMASVASTTTTTSARRHNQRHHPNNTSSIHTLDDSNVSSRYSPQIQTQLQRELSKFDKRNALKIGLVLGHTSLPDQAVRALPSLISQCHLTAVTLLKTSNESTKNGPHHEETRDWLREHASGYPILERYMTCDNDSDDDNDENNDAGYGKPPRREAGRVMVPSYHSCGKLVVTSSGYGRGFAKEQDAEGSERNHDDGEGDDDDYYYRDLRYYQGWPGYEDMLAQDQVDAVYVLCPSEEQPELVLMALKAQKHVLVYDPQSTNLEQFRQQVQQAKRVKRCIQFSTLLLHQYRVQTFLDSAAHHLGPSHQNMHLQLQIHTSDLPKLGLPRALVTRADALHLNPKTDNCIRRLARYGVLCALLLLEQQQPQHARPVSVQITQSTCLRVGGSSGSFQKKQDQNDKEESSDDDSIVGDDENNDGRDLVVQAQGVVQFTGGRQLTFTVGYITHGPTRQVLEVHAPHRYATLNDLCLPGFSSSSSSNWNDSSGTYRVYEKEEEELEPRASTTTNGDGDWHVTGGEAVDVLSGPPLHVRVWRGFAQLCRAVEEDGNDEKSESVRQLQQLAEQYTRHSIQLKSILNHLEESQRRGHVEVQLNDDNGEDEVSVDKNQHPKHE